MAGRSIPQAKVDERAFPVRIFIIVPETGLGRDLDSINEWLRRVAGRGQYAVHAGGRTVIRDQVADRIAIYFRHPSVAAACLEAFPFLELADSVPDPMPWTS